MKDYYSKEKAFKYMGYTQFKNFLKCPSMAMAILNGEYKIESDAFIAGSFMDAYFENDLIKFSSLHPELFKRDGTLLAKFNNLLKCINVIKNDEIMYKLCTGKQQVVMTGKIEGVEFKIMIDSLLEDRIVDRKTMANFNDVWSDIDHCYEPWWKAYGYDLQACIYHEIAKQNGYDLPFEIVAISKEKTPDKRWVRFTQSYLDKVMEEIIKPNVIKFDMIKQGLIEADECGECDYCKSLKKLESYEEI